MRGHVLSDGKDNHTFLVSVEGDVGIGNAMLMPCTQRILSS